MFSAEYMMNVFIKAVRYQILGKLLVLAQQQHKTYNSKEINSRLSWGYDCKVLHCLALK
jgi:hypothetical protein